MPVFGRHGIGLVGDPDPGLGVFERAGLDRLNTVFDCVGSFRSIEPEPGLAVGFTLGVNPVIGAVTHNAFGGEDGANVLIEGNFGSGR